MPMPTNGAAQTLVATWCEISGIDQPANYGKAAGAAKTLVNAGVTPETLPDLMAYIATWAKGGIDLSLCAQQVDKWRAKRPTAKPIEEPWVFRGA